LSENYRSSEQAIKELVDNSWDAEAENVWVTIPKPEIFTKEPIIVQDDGSGMTNREFTKEYLVIANGRLSKYGERTPYKKRHCSYHLSHISVLNWATESTVVSTTL
jgi:DNA topoisomerase VI subunit B